jgi:hypothetical protein
VKVEFDAKKTLATISASHSGTFRALIKIPAGTATGSHRIVAVGTSASGESVEQSTPLVITADTTPPNIVTARQSGALAISTDSIDTSSSSQTVQLTIRVQDAGSGFLPSSSKVVYSNGTNSAEGSWTLVSGNANDGTYDYDLVFNQGISAGIYNIESINLVDDAGNQQSYTRTEIQGLGYDLSSLAITDNTASSVPTPATTPPNIVAAGQPGALAISTAAIDTAVGNQQTVQLTIRVQDSGSGFSPSSSSVNYSNGVNTAEGSWTLVSGNANDGTYDYDLVFNQGISAGVYNIESINLVDDAGNQQSYTRTEVQGLGYDLSSLAITDNTGSDTTPPNIVAAGQPGALAISTDSIDTSSSSQTVQLTIRVQDAGSGFLPSSSNVVYSNGTNSAEGSWTLVSGNANDGTYAYNLVFNQGISAGVYNIESINLVDDAGNHQSYTRTEIQGLGYDLSSLAITNNS